MAISLLTHTWSLLTPISEGTGIATPWRAREDLRIFPPAIVGSLFCENRSARYDTCVLSSCGVNGNTEYPRFLTKTGSPTCENP